MSPKIAAAALALALLAGCAQIPKKAFNRDAASHIRSVTIAQVEEAERYEAIVAAHPGANFGLIGGLVAAADMHHKSNRLTEALDPEQTRLRQRFVEKLTGALQQNGYRVLSVTAPAGTSEEQIVTLAQSRAPSDATIAITVVGRYMAAGATSDYFPHIVVKVRKTDGKAGTTVYEDTFTYGYTTPQVQTVHFASDASYRFANIDLLVADPARTRDGLLRGLDAIVAQIAADLKRP